MTIRSRSGRLAVSGVTAAVVAAAAAASAGAHIPGAGNGVQPATNGPDLRSVTVNSYDVSTDQQPTATYCFDETVASTGSINNYSIFGYDSARYFKPVSISPSSTNTSCVVATFAAHQNINQGTVGAVDPGAAGDASGAKSDYASEPLAGSVVAPVAGTTSGPDLVGARLADDSSTDNEKIVYTFDEPLNPVKETRTTDGDGNTTTTTSAYSGADFGFANSAGAITAGSGAVAISGSTATVSFGNAAGISTATAFRSAYNAVQDYPENVASGAGTPWTPSAYGVIVTGSTGRPSLQRAQLTGQQQYTFSFSAPIANPDKTAFHAIFDNGDADVTATDVQVSGQTVVATFPVSTADPNSVVSVGVDAGAVTDSNGTTPNSVGTAPVATANSAPGYTAGPDLLSVSVDQANRAVTYNYDEPVLSSSVTAASFRAIGVDGAAATATGGLVFSGSSVKVNFGSDADNAVAYTNAYNRVTDLSGNPNPAQSVGRGVEATPVSPVTPVTPVTPPPPSATRQKASTSIKVRIKGSYYVGTIKSSQKTCTYKRTIVLKRKVGKKTRSIRHTRTKSNGSFKIKRTASTRGKSRVYVVASEKLTSMVNCTAKGSPKKKG